MHDDSIAKGKKYFYWAVAVFFLLFGALMFETGVISFPDIKFNSTSATNYSGNGSGVPPTSVQQNTSQTTAPETLLYCSEFGCPPTAEEAAAASEAFKASMWYVKAHWLEFTTGLLTLVAFIMSLVFFSKWRAAKKAIEAAKKAPVFVGFDGKEVHPPKLKSKATLILPGDPRISGLSWETIIGQEVAKTDILEIVDFINNRDKYKHMQARLPRGVLLYGAHGVGKTLIARTLASVCNIPVLEIVGSDFVHMFVGVGANSVKELYEDADEVKKLYGACIVFIDEAEGVARIRGQGHGSSEHDQTTNQFLGELDGIIPRENVITVCATNRRDQMDPAALRPKRLDRQIEFFNPNIHDRLELLKLYIPEEIRDADLDLHAAAKATVGSSGAHMENYANEAKLLAVRWGLPKVNNACLDEGIATTQAGARRDSDRKLWTADEVATVRVHEGGHALLYWLLTGKAPLRFTMVPRGGSGGHVSMDQSWTLLRTKESMRDQLVVAFGGWAATFVERNGQHDTGLSQDLQQATDLASDMVTRFGMSKVGFCSIEVLQKRELLSEEMRADIAKAINELLDEAKNRAVELIKANLEKLRTLVNAVDEEETILSPRFEQLFMKEAQLELAFG